MADDAARIEEIYRAFARGDIPTVLGGMDPQIEWHEAEHAPFWTGQPFVGTDAVVQHVFMRVGEAYGDTFRLEPVRFLDCGHAVVVELRYHGVVQATGKEFDVQAAHVWDLGPDGKVTRFQQYADTWAFAEAAGETPGT